MRYVSVGVSRLILACFSLLYLIEGCHQNGRWRVDIGPALPDPGRDEDPPGVPAGPDDVPQPGSPGWQLVPSRADWPDWTGDEAYLAVQADDEYPGTRPARGLPVGGPPSSATSGTTHRMRREAGPVSATAGPKAC